MGNLSCLLARRFIAFYDEEENIRRRDDRCRELLLKVKSVEGEEQGAVAHRTSAMKGGSMLPKWLVLVGYGISGVIVGAALGWGVAQFLSDPAAKMSIIEVGGLLGGIFSVLWRVNSSE